MRRYTQCQQLRLVGKTQQMIDLGATSVINDAETHFFCRQHGIRNNFLLGFFLFFFYISFFFLIRILNHVNICLKKLILMSFMTLVAPNPKVSNLKSRSLILNIKKMVLYLSLGKN